MPNDLARPALWPMLSGVQREAGGGQAEQTGGVIQEAGEGGAMTTSNAKLNRQTFTTSRELEYFTEGELTAQTGYGRQDWWPGVVVKELIDNSLDACEQAGVAPHIQVDFRGDSLAVGDNGPGLPVGVLERVLDFTTRTSDKAAYISPTRGAQGNALKVILAIPYVLNSAKPGRVEVESSGIRHTVLVSTDQVLQRPQIDHQQEEIVKNGGTRVRVAVDAA